MAATALFACAMLAVPMPSQAAPETDIGALRILADGALAEAYEADFRQPALRIFDDGWHTGLASRLRRQVVAMYEETAG
ncbi:hypothetical protein E5675_15305 [Sphingopyxis sp. PAMC25046]|uniref:hypothetical protein n=1 Tax=Sphingopyxis sp. PAMC25046 TaxID=2565556 RepID=UPI00109DD257|nr:hypothetical protein [Sphingopyxis sp. PAMC25046]QCB55666.1 hypothetical protein E5675_15305 [Sphingopyxis sp. PAMC25046]